MESQSEEVGFAIDTRLTRSLQRRRTTIGITHSRFILYLWHLTFFLIQWLMEHNLLAGQVFCDKCDHELAKLVERPEKLDRYSRRCRRGQDFERNIRSLSYFDTFRLPLADVINFIKQCLDGHTLKKAAGLTNIHYKYTVDWASYIRDIFMQYASRPHIIERWDAFNVGRPHIIGSATKPHPPDLPIDPNSDQVIIATLTCLDPNSDHMIITALVHDYQAVVTHWQRSPSDLPIDPNSDHMIIAALTCL